jgi:hypothetical protein
MTLCHSTPESRHFDSYARECATVLEGDGPGFAGTA